MLGDSEEVLVPKVTSLLYTVVHLVVVSRQNIADLTFNDEINF